MNNIIMPGAQGGSYDYPFNNQGSNQGVPPFNPWDDPEFVKLYNKTGIGVAEHSTNKATDDFYHIQSRKTDLCYQEELMKLKAINEEKLYENRLARCEVAELDQRGEIHIRTRNLTIEAKPRMVTNFRCIDTIIYINADDPQEKALMVSLDVGLAGTKKTFVFFDLKKCGNGKYIIDKFFSVGAEINACSEAKKKEYSKKILTCIVQNCKKTIVVPKRRGWYKTEKDILEFFDGKWTWEDVVRYGR